MRQLLVLVALSTAEDELRPDQIRALQEIILPQTGEQAWSQIPWLVDLWEARRQAAQRARPIFLWEMDGHPLGCT